MKFRMCLFSFFIIFFLVSGCSKRVVDMEQVSPEEKIVIKFSHVVAESTPKGMAAQRFASLVRERTGGRVEVQVFANSTLYKDGEEIQALQSGAVQMIAPATSKLSSIYPQWQVLDLPYAFLNVEAVHRAMEGELGQKLFGSLKQNNMVGLAFWDSGFKQMTNSKRPLVKPADFEGLSFRVMINSNVLKRQFERLHAKPVELTFDDLYRYLESGLIDGQENTITNIYSRNLFKVQKYLTISDHGYMGYAVIANARFWDGLPPDIKRVIEETLEEVTAWERQQSLRLAEEDLQKLRLLYKENLVELSEDEKKEWQRVLMPLYNEFRKILGDELIDLVLELNPALKTSEVQNSGP